MSKIVQKSILRDFEITKQVGSGSYGYVWSVISKKNNKKYALKKVYDAFQNNVDAQRTYREISVLLQLDCPYVIKLENVIKSKGNKDIYLLFELMENRSLYFKQVKFYINLSLQSLQNNHKKFIFYQILLGLDYLHTRGLIHRDLKPTNILVNSDTQIKICDFGLVRTQINKSQNQNQISNVLTDEVATKWYRAPQLLLGSKSYGKQIDVWSFGCIMLQVLIKKPTFNAFTTQEIFYQMLQLNQGFTEEDIKQLNIEGIQRIVSNFSIKHKSLKNILGKNNQEYFDIIKKCLNINPKKRITIKQALSLPIFNQIRHLIKQLHKNNQEVKRVQLNLNDNTRFQTKIYCEQIYKMIHQTTNERDSNLLSRNQSLQKKLLQIKFQQRLDTKSQHRTSNSLPHFKKWQNGQKTYCQSKREQNKLLFQMNDTKYESLHSQNRQSQLNRLTKMKILQIKQNLPYFKPLKVCKKSSDNPSKKSSDKISKKSSDKKQSLMNDLHKNQSSSVFNESLFLNKFSKKGKEYFSSQISQSQKQFLQEKKTH